MWKINKEMWNRFEKVALIITTLAAILAIISFFLQSESRMINNAEVESNEGVIVENNEGSVIINYPINEDNSASLAGVKDISITDKKNIFFVSEELLDLSYAGIYPVSMEGVVEKNGITYYKKGAVISVKLKNVCDEEIITDINFAIDNIEIIKNYEVDFIPLDLEDGVGIYAINNGNLDVENYSVKLGTTFNNIWDENESIYYETEDCFGLELLHGEVIEIYRYSYDTLSDIFNSRNEEGWLHVFVIDSNDKMINFEPFICNIVYDGFEFSSIINQGGDGFADGIIPIFLDKEKDKIEIINKHPEIKSNSITEVQLLILPSQSVKVKFHIEFCFSDNTKLVGKMYTAYFFVPIYDDENDYLLLREAMINSRSKQMLYGRDEQIDSIFLYNPKKFYDSILK